MDTVFDSRQYPATPGAAMAPENVNTVNASGSTLTIPDPVLQSMSRVVLSANCTFTFPAARAGKQFVLALVQDGTGSRTVAWPGIVKFAGGVKPTLTTTANAVDVFAFICLDGTNWLGQTLGLDVRSGLSVTDTFTRADSSTSLGTTDSGQTYTVLSGVWGISSNQAYTSTSGVDVGAVIDVGVTDQTVTVTLVNGGNGGYGVVARCVDMANCIIAYAGPSSGSPPSIYKKIGGAYTALGSPTGSFNPGDTLTLIVTGTTVTVKKNGTTTLMTTTDSSLPTGTKAGLMVHDSSTLHRFDNLSIS